MMEWLRSYVLTIFSAAALACLVRVIGERKSGSRNMLQLACGVFLIAAVLAPLGNLDLEKTWSSLTAIKLETMEAAALQDNDPKTIMDGLIIKSTEAYILDKAEALGAEVGVSVILADGDAYSYPYEVKLSGHITPYQMQQLTAYIDSELGIPPSRQEWR